MSFDYYQKTSSPSGRSAKVTARVEDTAQAATKRQEGLTKSVKKRKQTIAFDEPDVSFSFTVTRPEHEKDESPSRRQAKSSSSTTSKVNSSTTRKTAGTATSATNSSRLDHSTTETNTSTQVPSKASAEMAAEAREAQNSKNATAGSSMRSSTPVKSTKPSSTSRRKSGRAHKESESEHEEPEKANQLDESSSELPTFSAEDEAHPTDSPSTPPLRHDTTTDDHTHKDDLAPNSKHGSTSQSKVNSRSSTSKDPTSKKNLDPETEEAVDKRNPKKRTSSRAESTASPKKAKLSETAADPSKSSKSAHESSKSKSKDSKSESKAVELEDNLVSYWDFITERRGETLLQKMKRDKKRKFSAEEEEMVRIVKNRFYAEAAAKYRPPNEIAPNPINDELEIAVERYQRIIDLLEHENAELEIIGHRARLQLDAEQSEELDSGNAASSAKSAPSTPGRTSKRGNKSAPNSAKKTTAAQRRASLAPVATMDVSTPTESSVAQIFKSLPPGETLLADEDREFLTVRPALSGSVNLPLLSRLQTRFDALEMLARQIGYVNDTFEEKAASTSAAMHAYMVPSGAPKINLAAMLATTSD